MHLTEQAQAILLLAAHFGKARRGDPQPLTPSEWGLFADWLRNRSLQPADLLRKDLRTTLSDWGEARIPIARIEALLNRGAALALATERWLRAGLVIITRADAAYPARLKKRLGTASPPVLFGCGNMNLLNQGGIAVIGSRNMSEADGHFSERLGALAAGQALSILSGGARGVDEAAMLGTLAAAGTAVGVLSHGLLASSASAKFRTHLLEGNLALVSITYPEAGFSVGNAMQRNKYIYCLADAAVVVHAGTTGGTWSGAVENLRRGWVPLWVKRTEDATAANRQLVEKGARWLDEGEDNIDLKKLSLPGGRTTADSGSGKAAGGRQKEIIFGESAATTVTE
ncbi:DNA-protecting protein DprA [bacterium]|nr:DNA-protecting protein DprA [candidate division CSSED10-310 bacterium]